jgi:hypothetical protein
MTLMIGLHIFFRNGQDSVSGIVGTIGDTENWADVSFSCQNF